MFGKKPDIVQTFINNAMSLETGYAVYKIPNPGKIPWGNKKSYQGLP